MPHLDLSDDEARALVALLTRTVADDRYPPSPRVRTLRGILAMLRPEPTRAPLPPLKTYEPQAGGGIGGGGEAGRKLE